MAKKTVQVIQKSPDGKQQVCNFINTTVREFNLMNRFDIYELNNIAEAEQKELIYLHMKKSWTRQSAYIKAPVVIKQAARLKENPSKSDFIVEFHSIDMNHMFDEKGNLVLGPLNRQKINEDGKFSFWDHAAQVMGYFSEE